MIKLTTECNQNANLKLSHIQALSEESILSDLLLYLNKIYLSQKYLIMNSMQQIKYNNGIPHPKIKHI